MVARVALVFLAGCGTELPGRPVVDVDLDGGVPDAGEDAGDEDAGPDDPSAVVFTTDRVHEIRIDGAGELDPGDDALPCDVTIDGEAVGDAEVEISRFVGLDGKASFAIGFGERFHDLRGLDVDAPASGDPSMMRDWLGLEVFRRTGVGVPRVAFSNVTVDGEPFGLYEIRERLDEDFLERTFGDATGHFYEHPGGGEITVETTRIVTGAGPKADTSDLELFVSFSEGYPFGPWMTGLGDVVDVDAFFAEWVVETIADVRGGYPYSEGGVWLYDLPATSRFVFVVGSAETAFGDVLFDVDTEPEARMFGRTWSHEDGHPLFEAAARALLDDAWDGEALLARRNEVLAIVADAVAADPRATSTVAERSADLAQIEEFLLGREDIARTMLDAVCGDGTIELGETCDDGNVDPLDGCDARCEDEYCGDRLVSIGEACDDAGCLPDCTGPFVCGDGTVDPGEDCDEGDVLEDDGCTSVCLDDACGDGIVQPLRGEACDGVGCRPDCSVAGACGDGVVDVGEDCDDQDADEGDGCLSDCSFGDCAQADGWTYCTATRTFDAARWKCAALGEGIGLPRSGADNDAVAAEALARLDAPWWVGADDRRVESAWRDAAGAPVLYLPWGFRQPNGGPGQNCMVMEPSRFDGGWNDKDCAELYPVVCGPP